MGEEHDEREHSQKPRGRPPDGQLRPLALRLGSGLPPRFPFARSQNHEHEQYLDVRPDTFREQVPQKERGVVSSTVVGRVCSSPSNQER
jgi:hypothetical protein